MLRFLGNIEAKVDGKGRVFFPVAFRKALQGAGEERIVLRKDVFQPCLVVYPESVWNAQMDMLRLRLNRWNARHQQIFRQFVADAECMDFDSNGRILIPKRCLQMANIADTVRFIGMDDTIELWQGDGTKQSFIEAGEFGSALEQLLGEDQTRQDTL